jgi:hypothetical protein
MAGKKIHELTEGKGSWTYPERPGSFTLGALRFNPSQAALVKGKITHRPL